MNLLVRVAKMRKCHPERSEAAAERSRRTPMLSRVYLPPKGISTTNHSALINSPYKAFSIPTSQRGPPGDAFELTTLMLPHFPARYCSPCDVKRTGEAGNDVGPVLVVHLGNARRGLWCRQLEWGPSTALGCRLASLRMTKLGGLLASRSSQSMQHCRAQQIRTGCAHGRKPL